jgi:type IV secretion system protein TrbG
MAGRVTFARDTEGEGVLILGTPSTEEDMKNLKYLAPIFLVSACAAPQTETLMMSPIPPEPEVRIVKEPVYVIEQVSEPTKLKPAKKVDDKAATRQASRKSILMPKPENFIGSTLEYPIVDGYLYKVLTEPNEITSIELPPGCKFLVKSPTVGDMRTHKENDQADEESNWEVIKSAHGGKTGPVAKVLIRPRIAGLTTTLQADTDCGPFRYKLVATEGSANETVRFRPELKDMGFPEAPTAEEGKASVSGNSNSCDTLPAASAVFAYTISGDSPVWAPQANQIFHNGKKDGGKTCVKLSDALASDEYPMPFIPTSGKEATIYSRITNGGYMEFDKILPFLALRLGEETVQIRLAR